MLFQISVVIYADIYQERIFLWMVPVVSKAPQNDKCHWENPHLSQLLWKYFII